MEGGQPVRALTRAPAVTSTRSLSTARSVLQVLALLVQRPAGIRADEVAASLGKSTSTAYYLLSSLCEEGFAVHEAKGIYRPARGWQTLLAAVDSVPPSGETFQSIVEELFVLTRRRSYLGVVRAGRIEIVAFRGRQGVPRMPGLGSEIRESAHALAMGKVVLAELEPAALARYVERGLRRYTEHTVTAPERLTEDLRRARADGFAVDREEFQANFCCIAAPIRDVRGAFTAAIGISMTANVFDAERESLAAVVGEVAARASSAEHGRGARRPMAVAS